MGCAFAGRSETDFGELLGDGLLEPQSTIAQPRFVDTMIEDELRMLVSALTEDELAEAITMTFTT